MKRKRKSNDKYKKNRIKKPSLKWFAVFAALLLLFAAFIYFGIKAGEYADKVKAERQTTAYITYEKEEL